MTDVNYGATLEAINNKADRDLNNTYLVPSPIDYVIETGANEDNSQWYRLWKSGWLEQGGQGYFKDNQIVTFLKPYKNTNYSLSGVRVTSGGTFGTKDLTATGFTVWNADENYSTSGWYACGYSA